MRSSAAGVLVCVLLLLSTPASAAGPEIFLRDEPEEYFMIDKLQGLGFLPGLMTGTRGLEAREVALEAGKEGKVAYDRFTDEGGVSGRDGNLKSVELSAAWQYR